MKIQVNGLDVWGNEFDGFEINDVLGSHGTVDVRSCDSFEVISALILNDIIYPGKYEIDDFGENETHYFANLVDCETGKPLLQLKRV